MVVSTGTRPAQIAINREIQGLALSKIKAPGFGAPIEPKTRKEESCSGAPCATGRKLDPGMQQGGADGAAL